MENDGRSRERHGRWSSTTLVTMVVQTSHGYEVTEHPDHRVDGAATRLSDYSSGEHHVVSGAA